MNNYENIKGTNEWYSSEDRNSYQEGIATDSYGNTVTIRRSQFNDSWYYGEQPCSEWEILDEDGNLA